MKTKCPRMEGRPSVFDDFEFLNKPDDGTCRIDEPSKPGEINHIGLMSHQNQAK